MRPKKHHRGTRRSAWLAVCVPALLACSVLAQPPQFNGRIERIGPLRVLRVWGSPSEMGFAHGYLLGDEYLSGILGEHKSASVESAAAYEQMCAAARGIVELPLPAREEIDGIFAGIEAAHGGVPTVAGLNRPLRLEDLILHNAGDMLRAFGCSGFTVWGERAGEAGVITGRNFDFPITREGLATQFVLVRHPTGRRRVATVTFPGYIGAFTGVNDAGVCAFMHDGTGDRLSRPAGRQTPVALVLKEMLEQASGAEAHTRTAALLTEIVPYPFSYLIRVVTPRRSDGNEPPERVFRVDAGGLSENPIGRFACITTNHYLDSALAAPADADPWSLTRYEELSRRAGSILSAGEAWSALDAVASANQRFPTLHALVVFPERGRLELAFAGWEDGVVPATRRPPVTIEFRDLFDRRE